MGWFYKTEKCVLCQSATQNAQINIHSRQYGTTIKLSTLLNTFT